MYRRAGARDPARGRSGPARRARRGSTPSSTGTRDEPRSDVAIVGAGMAGASLAAEIAGARVGAAARGRGPARLSSTGRSAAFWSETYGGPLIQPLTSASGRFLAAPPADFADEPFLRPRGAVHLADAAGEARARRDGRRIRRIGRSRSSRWTARALEARIPGPEAGLGPRPVRAELRRHRRRRRCTPPISDARAREAPCWSPTRGVERAGAERRRLAARDRRRARSRRTSWSTPPAPGPTRCAARPASAPLGIQPYRRTIAQLRDRSAGAGRPAAGDRRLRAVSISSPRRAAGSGSARTTRRACDAVRLRGRGIDVALAIDRLRAGRSTGGSSGSSKLGGPRSFAPDRLPVYGFAPGGRGFFWCAGQGGFGIQTAPAGGQAGRGAAARPAPRSDGSGDRSRRLICAARFMN